MRGGRALAALVVAGVAAVAGGYALYGAGHSAGHDEGYAAGTAHYADGAPAYRAIYARGRARGANEGRARGEQAGRRVGERAGQRIGEREGERVGFQQGRHVGLERGEQDGVPAGAQTALGGFGDWNDGAYYVVTVQPGGQAGVPHRIATRTALQPLTDYRLCEHDEQRLCSLPVVVASGG